ncbi:odorant receptor 22c-like isoform X2 [Lasioglossum baleicum]|uniref:odorant receptor 22c-like isoform X2 n=1 Tax=Lasioglossum baleicum TaxID=434251 RepID=UPI003FCDD96C
MVTTVVETIDNSWSDYSLQLSRWNLEPIGFWPPSSSQSRLKRVASITMVVVSYTLIMLTVIPSMLYVMLSDDNVRQKLRVLGPLTHWFVGCCDLTVLLMKSKQIRLCIDHVEADWQIITRLQDQQVMQKYTKFSRFISMVLTIWWHSSVVISCAATAMTIQPIKIGNETRLVHPLPCGFYLKLLDVYTSPANEIALAVQFSSVCIVNAAILGSHSLVAVLVAHACGQLKVLTAWITEFVNDFGQDRKDEFCMEIGIIVEHHLRALSLMSRIEDVMNRICFMGLYECTLDVCLLGYYILTEWADHNIPNLSGYFGIIIAIIFDVFVVCYIGEMMSEQSIKIGDVVYMTNWYCLPSKTVLDLTLIIRRSSVLIKMTAGKLIHMSVYTFADVIKTSFAYLNFLRQTT